jgi:hypothetical protein
MASRMTISYGPQVTQVNEKPPLKSSLDLTLMQHPHDEDLELQGVCLHLKVEPLRAWYYRIFLNFHTLVIFLQVDSTSDDELENIYEGFYEIEDTFIFTWSSILGRHYSWLPDPIRLLLNSKVDYLVHTIQRILDFLQL